MHVVEGTRFNYFHNGYFKGLMRELTSKEVGMVRQEVRRCCQCLPAEGKAYVKRNVTGALRKREREVPWNVVKELVLRYTDGWGSRGAGRL